MKKEEIHLALKKINAEIIKAREKTKQRQLEDQIEEKKNKRWGMYGAIGSMLLLMTAILVTLLVN